MPLPDWQAAYAAMADAELEAAFQALQDAVFGDDWPGESDFAKLYAMQTELERRLPPMPQQETR